jgi:hypothetical protein
MAESSVVVENMVVDQTSAPVPDPEPTLPAASEPEMAQPAPEQAQEQEQPQDMAVVDQPNADPLPETVPEQQQQNEVQALPPPAVLEQQSAAQTLPPAVAVAELATPKKKRMPPLKAPKTPRALIQRKVCRRDIDKMLKARFATVGPTVRSLFTFDDCAALNELGDIRFGECVLVSQMGPFGPNESIRIIDWMPSLSTVMLSKTAKVSDTVALEIMPASVVPQAFIKIA